MQPSPWRWPTAPQNTASRLPYLNHSASLVDLHDNSWGWRERPSSPTESSSSSASDVLTPTASTVDVSESRSSTPTPSTPPRNVFGTITYSTFASKNPWRNRNHEAYSPPISPKGSPHSISPQSQSRSSTPTAAAPQPVRPAMVHAATDPTPINASHPRVSPPPLPPATPLPFNDVENDKLPIQPITPDLIAHVVKLMPSIITRAGWKRENVHWVYQWAIQQPKTALLLWMCDDLQAWKRANFYQLKDSEMPFETKDLDDIATDPDKVVRLQWKVAMKPLPRGGQHVEFQTQEHVPLQEYGPLVRTDTSSKTVSKVRYLDGSDNQLYVRKRFEISADRPQDKKTILEQIRRFNRLEHDNVATIMSSYARGSVVAFLTPLANHNLEEYLASVEGFSHCELLLSWAADLCNGLAYLHQKRLEHKNIRPQKILIDTSFNRIYFSVFSISPPARSSTYGYLYRPYSVEPAYIYAAPELIARQNTGQPADVFSLGCCLLDMLSVAKGQPVGNAQKYRSADSHDLSFHANLDRVQAWIKQLAQVKIPAAASRRNTAAVLPAHGLIRVIWKMLSRDPKKRPDMKQVVNFIEDFEANGGMAARRRNSDIVPSTGYAATMQPAASAVNLTPSPPRYERREISTPPRNTPNPLSSSPSMRNPTNDFSSLTKSIAVEYSSPPRNTSMRRNALADFSTLQDAIPEVPSNQQQGDTPAERASPLRTVPPAFTNPPQDLPSEVRTLPQRTSPPADYNSMRKNAINDFMNPPRQHMPVQYSTPPPPPPAAREEFPRSSAIWDLQSLSPYYGSNTAPTASAIWGGE